MRDGGLRDGGLRDGEINFTRTQRITRIRTKLQDNLKACTRTSSNKIKARLYTTYISYMASQRGRSLKIACADFVTNLFS